MVPLSEAPLNLQEDKGTGPREEKKEIIPVPFILSQLCLVLTLYARNWEWTSVSQILVSFVLVPSQRGNHKNGRRVGGERVTGHIAEEIKDK